MSQDSSGRESSDQKQFIGRFAAIVREEGMAHAFRKARRRLLREVHNRIDRRFDRLHNVETCEPLLLDDLAVTGDNRSHAIDYLATPVKEFQIIMSRIPKDVRDYSFIDFGSGKGRVLLMASQYPFREIIGIEFADELHQIARKNIESYSAKGRQCFEVRSECADATAFEIPDNKCVLFFSNPFEPPVLRKVLDNVANSYRKHPRKMFLIYSEPEYRELFDALEFVHISKQFRFWPASILPLAVDLLVYETNQ